MRSLWLAMFLGMLLTLSACTLDVAAPPEEGGVALLPATPTPSAAPGPQPALPLAPTPTPQPADGGAPGQPPPVVEMVQDAFAQELGLQRDEVKVVEAEPATWPDDCLGAALPGEACGGGPVSGYRIVLELAGERYTYHADEAGALVRPVMPEGLGEGETLLLWTREDANGCAMAMVSEVRAEFGPCSGLALRAALTPEQRAIVRDWVTRLAPFEAQTPAGYVQVAGRGAAQPTPEEQRQIAEWVSSVSQAVWQGGN